MLICHCSVRIARCQLCLRWQLLWSEEEFVYLTKTHTHTSWRQRLTHARSKIHYIYGNPISYKRVSVTKAISQQQLILSSNLSTIAVKILMVFYKQKQDFCKSATKHVVLTKQSLLWHLLNMVCIFVRSDFSCSAFSATYSRWKDTKSGLFVDAVHNS